MLTITIFDDDGRMVSESVTDADLASESEVSEMIQMMNAGMPLSHTGDKLWKVVTVELTIAGQDRSSVGGYAQVRTIAAKNSDG